MWTLICFILMIYVFVKMVGLAIRMSWGIFKILLNLVLLPLILVGLIFGGLLVLALPILIVIGIVIRVISD